jgi:hypothetical protein
MVKGRVGSEHPILSRVESLSAGPGWRFGCKKGSLAHWAMLPPNSPVFSLSSSRDSLPSRIGKRGKCRAIANDRAISSRRYGKATPHGPAQAAS